MVGCHNNVTAPTETSTFETTAITESSSEETTVFETTVPPTTQPAITNYIQLGETVETAQVRITYQKCEEWSSTSNSAPDGMKAVRFYFHFENFSDEDSTIGTHYFSCFADNVLCSNYYMGTDILNFDILPASREAAGWVYFLVPYNAETIEVEYKINFNDFDKLIFTASLPINPPFSDDASPTEPPVG